MHVFLFIIEDGIQCSHPHRAIFSKVLLLRAGEEGGMRASSQREGECTEKGWEPLM